MSISSVLNMLKTPHSMVLTSAYLLIFSPILLARTDVDLGFNHWYPSVSVDIGKHSFPIMFDLGGGDLMLGSGLLEKHRKCYRYTGKLKKVSDAEGHRTILKEVMLKAFKIGSKHYKNVTAWEMNDKDASAWGGGMPDTSEVILNGSIGTGFFKGKKQNLLINYKKKQLTLLDNFSTPKSLNLKLWPKTHFIAPHITTSMKVNATPMHFIWDTGAEFNFVQQNRLEEIDKKRCTPDEAKHLGVTQKNCYSITAQLTSKILDSNKLWQRIMTLYGYDLEANDSFDGIIGAPFFREHQVFINFKTHTVFWQAFSV